MSRRSVVKVAAWILSGFLTGCLIVGVYFEAGFWTAVTLLCVFVEIGFLSLRCHEHPIKNKEEQGNGN